MCVLWGQEEYFNYNGESLVHFNFLKLLYFFKRRWQAVYYFSMPFYIGLGPEAAGRVAEGVGTGSVQWVPPSNAYSYNNFFN